MFLNSTLSATTLTGLFLISKLFILIFALSEIMLPFHLLGLNGLIGVIANFFEFRDKIGPWTDKLYAVLPAGVDTNTPSQINFLIKNKYQNLILEVDADNVSARNVYKKYGFEDIEESYWYEFSDKTFS